MTSRGLNWLSFNQSKTSFPLCEHNYSLLSNETRNLPPFHLYMKNNPYSSSRGVLGSLQYFEVKRNTYSFVWFRIQTIMNLHFNLKLIKQLSNNEFLKCIVKVEKINQIKATSILIKSFDKLKIVHKHRV